MSSGFPGGGGPDFYSAGGITNGRSTQQFPYRSGILTDPAPAMVHRGTDLIGKRSFAELQQQQQFLQQQQQQFQQQMGLNGVFNLRNVKPRMNYQQTSPISPLSPMDFSPISPEMSSISTNSSMNPRYGLPILHQLRQQNRMNNFNPLSNSNFMQTSGNSNTLNKFFPPNTCISVQNSVQNSSPGFYTGSQLNIPEKKMMNRLQELEKQLLDDDDSDAGGEAVSVVTNSEWCETIQNLNLMGPIQKPISRSPTSSSSSCSSTSASPAITSPKQLITEAATAISEGRTEAAADTLTRLFKVSNTRGNSEQRLAAYMAVALRARLKPSEYPPPVNELYFKEHVVSTQLLYEVSPCFKLGFMAANRAILEATVSKEPVNTLHVVDFDIGQGGQYVHLVYALAAEKLDKRVTLKITTLSDSLNGGDEKLKVVGDGLKVLASKIGVPFHFSIINLKIFDLRRENLGIEDGDSLVVNFAFKLYKLPDESVSTDNLRDSLLRCVKGLSPEVVTVVEQEMNANTAAFEARVNENCGYYGVLFESLDVTVSRESPERVKIEEGLSRSLINSVACEGRDRVERCEVFGKWRARMSMAGFEPKPMSQLVADSLRSKLSSGPRGNPGFTVNEMSGGICFGWMGRTLTVASAWH